MTKEKCERCGVVSERVRKRRNLLAELGPVSNKKLCPKCSQDKQR